jgi:hypothetical protein
VSLGLFLLALSPIVPCYVAFAACYTSQIICEVDQTFLSSSLNPLCELALVAHSLKQFFHTDLETCPMSLLWALKPNFICTFGRFWKFTAVAINRNYASLGGGSRIICGYTSQTHNLPPPSPIGALVQLLFGYNPQYANVQGTGIMLEEDTSVGECWCMSGAVGHVAIQLLEAVFISHLSLDYAMPRLLSEEEITNAPQNMSLWVLLPLLDVKQDGSQMRPAKEFEFKADQDTDFPPGSQFVHALEFQYDIRKPPTHQIFPFQFRMLSLSQTVILEIKSNEGGATTCLYWLGIYGAKADRVY